jgi:hypothetical protein
MEPISARTAEHKPFFLKCLLGCEVINPEKIVHPKERDERDAEKHQLDSGPIQESKAASNEDDNDADRCPIGRAPIGRAPPWRRKLSGSFPDAASLFRRHPKFIRDVVKQYPPQQAH